MSKIFANDKTAPVLGSHTLWLNEHACASYLKSISVAAAGVWRTAAADPS